MRVLIIDYELCNLDSVKRVVEVCGGEAILSQNPQDIKDADKLILPGVASFADAMRNLKKKSWDKAIIEAVEDDKIPLMGFCLGMQLLAEFGEEGGGSEGLGLIPGRVIRFESQTERIPHMGWNEVLFNKENKIFTNIQNQKDFYFAHSYHYIPTHSEHILAQTPYCGQFVSSIVRGNIFGMQFHPEKSQRVGMQLIKNFLENPC